jgi:hypothetical protein
MATIKAANRDMEKYHTLAKPYSDMAGSILKNEKEILATTGADDADLASKKIILANEMLNLVSNYVVINGICHTVLKVNDEDAMNNARKSLYRSIIYLEEVVTGYIDVPFSDYKDRLDAIEAVTPAWRYFLVRKIGLSIDLVASAYSGNAKWKWTFVDLRGRFVAVAKNLIDMDKLVANSDPRSPHYEPTVCHLRLVKKLLGLSAERYREKYELATKSVDDFQKSLTFLSSLRRLSILTGDREKAETVKKKLDAWTNKLTADMNKLKASKG